jgi:serine/threonine-protein kinase
VTPKPSSEPLFSACLSAHGAPILAPGQVVADRYRVMSLLGEGGMGVVYRAEHVHMRKVLALKVLHPDVCNVPQVVARFEREAVAAARIDHPHVTAAKDFGRLQDGSFFLVLEYVAGRSLRQVLEAGPVQPERALHILRGIVSAVGSAHAHGVVHRDLKPENVMLVDRDGDPDFVKVLDFGVAKLDPLAHAAPESGVQPLTRLGAIIGTPDYMAPEQALGQSVDARADLYALGVILFEMIAGERPFRGGVLTVLRDRVMAPAPELPARPTAPVDPGLQAIVRKLMALSADERFQTATELEAALDSLTARATPAEPTRVDPPPTPIQSALRAGAAAASPLLAALAGHRRRLVAIAAAGIVLAIVAIWATAGGPQAERSQPPAGTAPRRAATAPTPSGATPVAPTVADDYPAPPDLPPPPSPAGSTPTPSAHPEGSAAPQSTRSRHTGPGGVYIPPINQWFK